MTSYGVMYRRHRRPEDLIAFARLVETVGFDELWVVEDCFWAGGVSAVSVALASTQRLIVGFGIAPAVVRNPAIMAMDLGGLARMFPGRLLAGFGHGVADWMRQIGAFPESQLTALGETVDVVRRLWAGDEVTMHGRQVHFDGVRLVFPPVPAPPVLVGATGPKSLDLAARLADGLMLPEGSSPSFVRAACERGGNPAVCAVYVVFAVADRNEDARAMVSSAVDQFAPTPGDRRLSLLGIDESVTEADRNGRFAVSGTPADCAKAIRAFTAAGATSVILVPQNDDDEQTARAAREVLPLLR